MGGGEQLEINNWRVTTSSLLIVCSVKSLDTSWDERHRPPPEIATEIRRTRAGQGLTTKLSAKAVNVSRRATVGTFSLLSPANKLHR